VSERGKFLKKKKKQASKNQRGSTTGFLYGGCVHFKKQGRQVTKSLKTSPEGCPARSWGGHQQSEDGGRNKRKWECEWDWANGGDLVHDRGSLGRKSRGENEFKSAHRPW